MIALSDLCNDILSRISAERRERLQLDKRFMEAAAEQREIRKAAEERRKAARAEAQRQRLADARR